MNESFVTIEMMKPLILGAAGGFILNMMNLFELSKIPKNERPLRDGLYWLFFIFWPIVGSFLTYMYISSGYKIDNFFALTTGLSAPTILQTLMSKTKEPERKKGDVEPE